MEKIVKGYVLKVVPYKENNTIITLLTNEGLETFNARGVMKPTNKNSSSCQLYTYGEYQLSYKQDGGNNTLMSGISLKTLSSLYENIKVSAVLGLLSESIIKNSDFENGFDIFDIVFNHFASGECNFSTIIAILLKMNAFYVGCDLEADCCASCGTTKNISTVCYDEGGFLCSKCALEMHKVERSVNYVKNFRYIVKAEMKHINSFRLDETVEKALITDLFDFLEKNAGVYFKSKSMILYLIK